MKILIYGISSSGKSYLTRNLSVILKLPYINGDMVRDKFNDKDFSKEGRIRQAERMLSLANNYDNVLVDFICPYQEYQDKFDFKILMDTKSKSNYPDTDKIFQKGNPNIIITDFNYDLNYIKNEIQNLLNKSNNN